MREGHSDTEAITAEGLEALEAELRELETNGRRSMAQRIGAARELGDLKENAEYHMAKEDQAHLETRIKRVRERLSKAVVVEVAEGGAFGFGQTAEVVDEASGKAHVWTIVGAAESDLGRGRLSAESPVGRALLGRAPGETVTVETPRGPRPYRLERILD